MVRRKGRGDNIRQESCHACSTSTPCILPSQDEDEPEGAGEEDEKDGFFVDDGYFSEDEGVRDSQLGGAGGPEDEGNGLEGED